MSYKQHLMIIQGARNPWQQQNMYNYLEIQLEIMMIHWTGDLRGYSFALHCAFLIFSHHQMANEAKFSALFWAVHHINFRWIRLHPSAASKDHVNRKSTPPTVSSSRAIMFSAFNCNLFDVLQYAIKNPSDKNRFSSQKILNESKFDAKNTDRVSDPAAFHSKK